MIDDGFPSLVQYQITGPVGTAATRITPGNIHNYRAKLETRLTRYRRRKAGILPARMT